MAQQDEQFSPQRLDEQLAQLIDAVDTHQHVPPTSSEHIVRELVDFYTPSMLDEQKRAERVYVQMEDAMTQNAVPEKRSHLTLLRPHHSSFDTTSSEREEPKRTRFAAFTQTLAVALVTVVLIGGFLAVFSLVHRQQSGTTVSAPRWQFANSANTPANLQTLTGVAVISDKNVWAVGVSGGVIFEPTSFYQSPSATSTPIIEHWNGQQWSIILTPQLQTQSALLNVSAYSASNIWAVGYMSNSTSVKNATERESLIEHWNGQQWSIIPSSNPGKVNNVLTRVLALSANNVWAVGYTSNVMNKVVVTHMLIEHWNGQQWSVVSSPDSGIYQSLGGISATSANDIWAVGVVQQDASTRMHTLIEHWNGQQWSIVSSPSPGAFFDVLTSVTAISPTNAWTVGSFANTNNSPASKTLIEHWNGQKWSVVSSPSVGNGQNYLISVTATSANDVWTVGYSSDGNSYRTLVEHWNGQQWSRGPDLSVRKNETYQLLMGIAYAPQSNTLWAVGVTGSFQPPTTHTLIVTLPE